MALLVVYVMLAYSYMGSKGFVIEGGQIVLSNKAYAKEKAFAEKVSGTLNVNNNLIRAKGSEDAPLVMYLFSSMACSHCKDFHNFILPKLERDFVAKNKLRLVFIHLPFDEMSMRAAKLSYCLPKEKYYDFISLLYQKRDWQFANNEKLLNAYAKKSGADDKLINDCKENKKLTSDILLIRDNAIKDFGVQATPSFLITGKDGSELITGSRKYDDLKQYLEKRLSGENNA